MTEVLKLQAQTGPEEVEEDAPASVVSYNHCVVE